MGGWRRPIANTDQNPPLPEPDGPLDPTVSASPIEEARPGRFTLMAAGWMPPIQLVTQALGLCCTADGLVVMVTMDGRPWSLPGGSVEDGESVEQAPVREVAEEAYGGASTAQSSPCRDAAVAASDEWLVGRRCLSRPSWSWSSPLTTRLGPLRPTRIGPPRRATRRGPVHRVLSRQPMPRITSSTTTRDLTPRPHLVGSAERGGLRCRACLGCRRRSWCRSAAGWYGKPACSYAIWSGVRAAWVWTVAGG